MLLKYLALLCSSHSVEVVKEYKVEWTRRL